MKRKWGSSSGEDGGNVGNGGNGGWGVGEGSTVFVVGLSYQATENDLKRFFKDCGTIT